MGRYRFETILFDEINDCPYATKAWEMIRNDDCKHAINYIEQSIHNCGAHITDVVLPFGEDDNVYQYNEFLLSWNITLQYVGLIHLHEVTMGACDYKKCRKSMHVFTMKQVCRMVWYCGDCVRNNRPPKNVITKEWINASTKKQFQNKF